MSDPIVEQIVEKMYGIDREDSVYIPVEGVRWCIRHEAPERDPAGGREICRDRYKEGVEDNGACVWVPLYIEAQDP